MSIKTYCGDCLEVMQDIPDKSVDLILCDPPYGTTANKWDSTIPLDKMWNAYHNIIKEGGAIAIFAQPPFSFILGGSNIKEFRHEWIWKKNIPQGFLGANKAPLRTHESILIFCSQGAHYNPQMEFTPIRTVRGKGTVSAVGTNYCKDNSYFNDPHSKSNVKYPTDVLEFPRDTDRHHRPSLHPTQKPVALCEYLIRTYTDEGMTVLDNCMGSGTTGVAAVQTGRNFIGIEKDPEYYQKAVERINKAEYKAKTRTTLEAFA